MSHPKPIIISRTPNFSNQWGLSEVSCSIAQRVLYPRGMLDICLGDVSTRSTNGKPDIAVTIAETQYCS
jgi:hypothetical protein